MTPAERQELAELEELNQLEARFGEREDPAEIDELDRLEAKFSTTEARRRGPELRATPTGVMAALRRVPAAIREDYGEALEQSGKPAAALDVPIGIARAIFSPLTGTSRALVGGPVRRTAEDIGLSPNLSRKLGGAAQFVAELAVPGVGLTRVPRLGGKARFADELALPRARTAQATEEVPAETLPRAPAGAAHVAALPSMRDALSETGERIAAGGRETFRQVSRPFAKSISYLDGPAKYSPTLKGLREEIEHSDLPGKGTAQLDFNERAMLRTGSFTQRFNRDKGALASNPEALRPLLDDIREYANTTGLDLGYVRGYFPRVYDSERLSKSAIGDAFIKKLDEYGIDQSDADIILRNLTDSDGIITNLGAGRSTLSRISPEMQRALADIPDDELKPFLRTNPEEVIPRYIGGVVRRAEYARTFGPNNERLGLLKKDIVEESLQSGRPLRNDEMKRIDDMAALLAGDYGRIGNPTIRAINDWATTGEYLITLPLSAMSSIAEPLIALERGGFKAGLKAIPATLDYAARGIARTLTKRIGKGQAKEDIEALGFLDSSMGQIMTEMMETGGKAQKVQNLFFKFNLLTPVTRLSQIFGSQLGKNMVLDNLTAISRGMGGARVRRELSELGIDAGKGTAWLKDGARRDHPYYERIRAAQLRFVNQTQINPRGTTKPLYMSNPKAKLFTMLKGYFTSAANTIGKRLLYKVVHGDAVEKARVAGMLALLLAATHLQRSVRDNLIYGGENPYTKDLSAGEKVWRSFLNTGLIGPIKNYTESLHHGYGQGEALAGTVAPILGQAVKLSNAAQAAARGKPERLKKEAFRMIPGAGVLAPRVFPQVGVPK